MPQSSDDLHLYLDLYLVPLPVQPYVYVCAPLYEDEDEEEKPERKPLLPRRDASKDHHVCK